MPFLKSCLLQKLASKYQGWIPVSMGKCNYFNAKTQHGEAATKERGIYAASPHGHLETLEFAESEPYRTEKRRERRAPKNLRQHERFGRIAVQRCPGCEIRPNRTATA
jgi:hypothetical protein